MKCEYCGREMRFVSKKLDAEPNVVGKLECPSRICRLLNYSWLVEYQTDYWVLKSGKLIPDYQFEVIL